MNSIHSTNSGKLLPQPDGLLKTFGPPVKLWHDPLLSHEPIMLGPCCWVSGWTKVVGQSAKPHASPEELAADVLATFLMPFSISCMDGQTVWGQVMPGERFDGPSYKQRRAAWTFMYSPEAVINMVRRVYEADGGKYRETADALAEMSLRNALALIRATAFGRGVDLANPASKRGWSGWLADANMTIQRLLEAGVWKFKGGEPVYWTLKNGRWSPRQPELLLALAPDAIASQVSEEAMLAASHAPLSHRLGVDAAALGETLAEPSISSEAAVSPDAFVGPGVCIKGRSVVEAGARLWRSVIDNTSIGAGTLVMRSILEASEAGAGASVVSSDVRRTSVGAGSSIACAHVHRSRLPEHSIVSPFGDLLDVAATKPVIIGGAMSGADIRTALMSMHMAGKAEHLKAHPVTVEVGGNEVEIWPVPMLGGGSRILGTAEKPVELEGAFIGSNAIIEPGAYVGFGCFVLGTLTGEEGLPPFTLSTAAGPESDGIGSVLMQFANLVITHMLGWTYQAAGADKAAAAAELMRAQIKRGMAALEWALSTRRSSGDREMASAFACFKSLRLYSEKQLLAGLDTYRGELADERWNLAFCDGELRFTGRGSWRVSDGIARWER